MTEYFDETTDHCSLKLSKCVAVEGEDVDVIEPLPDLLRALVYCATFEGVNSMDIDEAVSQLPLGTQISDRLAATLRKLLVVELEDLSLDQTAEYSLSTLEGRKNQHMAVLLLRIYEAFIEHVANSPWSHFRADVLGTLFNLASRVKSDPKLALKAPEKELSKTADGMPKFYGNLLLKMLDGDVRPSRKQGRNLLPEFSRASKLRLTPQYRLVEVVVMRVPTNCPSPDHVAALQHSLPFCLWVESTVLAALQEMRNKTELARANRTFAFKVGQLHLAESVRLVGADPAPSRTSLVRSLEIIAYFYTFIVSQTPGNVLRNLRDCE